MTYAKLAFLLIILFTTSDILGQIPQNDQGNLNDITFFLTVNNPEYKDAEGSRYLFDEFVPAKISGISNSYPVRFDAVDDIIEFKENGEEIKGLTLNREYRIQLMDGSNRVFITRTYINDSGNLKKSFFEIVHDGDDFQLLKKERFKYLPAQPAKSSYEPAKPARFMKLQDQVYIDYPDDSLDYLIRIPKKKKKLKVFFGAQLKQVEAFAKKQNLEYDATEDFVKIMEHYLSIK
nr:hypothetical protein [Allomuricauda sp.]